MNPLSPYQNVYAPEAYNGVPVLPANSEAPFDYIYDVSLTANQQLIDQTLSIDTDADFELRAVLITVPGGAFSVRWSDGQGYYTASSEILNSAFTALAPYPCFPSLVIAAGGRIGIDISDLSGGANDLQLAFRGVKVYTPQAR
jgi:hypothetical protein